MQKLPYGLTTIYFPESEFGIHSVNEFELPYFSMKNLFRFSFNDYLIDVQFPETEFVELYDRALTREDNFEALVLGLTPEISSIEDLLVEFRRHFDNGLWKSEFVYDHPEIEEYGFRIFDRSTYGLFEEDDEADESYLHLKRNAAGVLYAESKELSSGMIDIIDALDDVEGPEVELYAEEPLEEGTDEHEQHYE
jgi:hypothetical protein